MVTMRRKISFLLMVDTLQLVWCVARLTLLFNALAA